MTVPAGTGAPIVPDVSVVVISYNDAARLAVAIASVQRQTLRNLEIIVVDDASTDGTADVVRGIAAGDPRVRYECLAENSGGCSAPRNRGIDVARAPWVMFCDSDDEYERHACKNLLGAAERLGADVVCGAAERVDVNTGKVRRWRAEIHDAERVADGLADFPELLSDTISVNKIYRRDLLVANGIRFPEGLLFEDQLFTLEAMATARKVAAIPETVYSWKVDRLSEEPSITQRRNEARNVESRIEVNRRIDAFLGARDLAAIQRIKDVKFLKHDLYLYLSSMLEVDDETAQVLIDRLIPYVSSVNLEPVWQLRPALRVAIYHLLVNDLAGLRSAMRFVKWASVVDVPIVVRDGREMWGCRHLDDALAVDGVPAERWLDVTDLHLLSVPFTQRRFHHRIDSLGVADGLIEASGTTLDYDGSLGDDLRLDLQFSLGGARAVVSVPARWSGVDGPVRRWQASGRPVDGLGRRLSAPDRGTVALSLTRDGLSNVTSVRAPQAATARIGFAYPGPTTWTGPDWIATAPFDNGTTGWRVERRGAWRSRLAALQRAWFRLPGTDRLATLTALVRRDVIDVAVHRIGRRLPRREVAVFETDAGRTCSGSVRAISEHLHHQHPEIAQAWVHRSRDEGVPPFARAVGRLTLRHRWTLARARYWVDDGTSSPTLRKPGAVTSVYVSPGVPIHRTGLDDPGVLVSRAEVRAVKRRAHGWGLVVAASTYDADTIRRAWAYSGEVVAAGLPRLDAVLRAEPAGEESAAIRRRLDLPSDRPIVLYAPALRDGERPPDGPLMDLDRWAAQFGDRAYLLVHRHSVDRQPVSTRLRFAVREVADAAELPSILAVCGLVISDYSSVIGDAALVGAPILLHQPDYERYVNRTKGLYLDTSAIAPVTRSMDELTAEVGAWLADPAQWDRRHAAGRAAFVADRCGPADGGASARAVAAIVAAGRPGPGARPDGSPS